MRWLARVLVSLPSWSALVSPRGGVHVHDLVHLSWFGVLEPTMDRLASWPTRA